MRKLVSSGLIVIAAMVVWMTAAEGDQPQGISRTELGRGAVAASYRLGGDAGSDVVVQSVRIEAGAASGWHTHPGPEVAIIKSGALTFFDGDDPKCAPKTYTAGHVLVGTGHVHQGRNLGTEPVEIVVTYFNVPPGKAATTPAERPGPCPA
jgi:quercetin dioxygenase-like cupin family protein